TKTLIRLFFLFNPFGLTKTELFYLFFVCCGGGWARTTSTQCVSPIHTKGRSRNELTIAVNIVMLQN
ncbi:MAG: hypothetical protein ACK6DE_17355, partial [Pseudanabaena sp.]